MIRYLLFVLTSAILLGVGLPSASAVEGKGPRLSELSGDTLSWVNLPDELTQRVMPVVAIQLKVGSTKEGSDYLRITPVRRGKVALRLAPRTSGENGYRVEAGEVWYWPDMSLLNLSHDVVVSASNCRLEGQTFDILLNHETTRMVDPKVISLPQGLVPIESDSVRIVGIGGQEAPDFHWDEKQEVARSGEKQEVARSDAKQVLERADEKRPTPQSEERLKAPPLNGKLEGALQEPDFGEPAPRVQTPKKIPSPSPTKQEKQETVQTEEFTIHILNEKKIKFENTPCEIDHLEKKIEEALRTNPDGRFVIHQSPGANSNLVKKVQQILTKAKVTRVRTVMEPLDIDSKTLQVEHVDAVNVDADTSVPLGPGGRLLWCYGPGKFYLNGKPFDEPSLRQALRGLAKDSPEIPIVVAGPRDAPSTTLKELASEVKAYGFQDVQLGLSSNRKGS